MREVISRSEALERGLKQYFTGKPCLRDHVVERKVNGRQCVECMREIGRRWDIKNQEKRNAGRRRRIAANPEKYRAKWHQRNASRPPENMT
jgi:hypothetical protein